MTRRGAKGGSPEAVLAAGIDAIAKLARTKAHGRSYRLRGRAKSLGPGNALVMLADEDTVVVRAFAKPRALEETSRAAWEDAALRLAELDAVVAEVVERYPSLAPAEPDAGLAEQEREILRSGGFDSRPLAPWDGDPLAGGVVEYARIIRDSLSVEEAGRRLGVNGSRVRQRLTGKPPTLYGVKKGREWRIPAFQFSREGLVPGIDRVIARLPRDLHPVAVRRWLTTPNVDLRPGSEGATSLAPLDWLRLGYDPEVVAGLAAEL